MTLDADEFIRRFLIHVLPDGFHRIRHYGLFANFFRSRRRHTTCRIDGSPDVCPSGLASDHAENGRDDEDCNACPCCGGRMIIVRSEERRVGKECRSRSSMELYKKRETTYW